MASTSSQLLAELTISVSVYILLYDLAEDSEAGIDLSITTFDFFVESFEAVNLPTASGVDVT